MKIEQAIETLFSYFASEATPMMVRCYAIGLADLEPKDLDVAVARSIMELKKLPLVSELRELVGIGGADARALAAWVDVSKTLPRGHMRHVDFEDRLINATIRGMSGTWDQFCQRCNEDDEKWVKQEFVRDYTKLAKSGVDGEVCRPLAGASESEIHDGIVIPPRPLKIKCSRERQSLLGVVRESSVASPFLTVPTASIKRVS